MPPIIDETKCIRCGLCEKICTMNIFLPPKDGNIPHIMYPEECWHCTACKMDCPSGAITLRIPIPYRLLHVKSEDLMRGFSL